MGKPRPGQGRGGLAPGRVHARLKTGQVAGREAGWPSRGRRRQDEGCRRRRAVAGRRRAGEGEQNERKVPADEEEEQEKVRGSKQGHEKDFCNCGNSGNSGMFPTA